MRRSSSQKSQQKQQKPFAPALESLESRTLMAAIGVSEVAGQLRVTGTAGDDKICITRADNGGVQISSAGFGRKTYTGSYDAIIVDALGGNDIVRFDSTITLDAVIKGGGGADRVTGGAGDDKLFAGGGVDTLHGGAGDDVLVSIGNSTVDSNTGGSGRDSFWADSSANEKITDATAAETARGNVHRVANFESYRQQVNGAFVTTEVPKSLDGQELTDPTLTSGSLKYSDFSTRPLFSENGPSPDDIKQGWLGDCYFLATLSSIADVNPDKIRESVVDLGDGTFAVQFYNGLTPVYVRVDGDLPTWSWGALSYANEGAGGSIWAAVMEKAYAYFRYGTGTYASLEGGWMSTVFSALNCTGSASVWSATDGADLLEKIDVLLDAGKSVTYAVHTVPSGAPLVSSHAYSVDRVIRDAQGNVVQLVLRNPWGVDGVGNDGSDDGYVTLSAQQAKDAFWGVIAADV